MLYQRIFTASLFAALVFWLIFYQPTTVLFYFLLIIVLVAAYEWARLSGLDSALPRSVYAVFLTVLAWAVQQYLSDYVTWMIYLSVMWWFSITFYLKIAVPKAASNGLKPDKLLIAFIIIPAAALAIREVHSLWQGAEWLFYALSVIWIADIGAYFSGKKFGKNKLAPEISPGKTREGFIGAVVATSIYTLLASYYFGLDTGLAFILVMLSIVITFISVSGDLYVSLLKREAGLKDSGAILPGHGGMLDRIDSLLAAMPVFLLGFDWWVYPYIQ